MGWRESGASSGTGVTKSVKPPEEPSGGLTLQSDCGALMQLSETDYFQVPF